MELRTITLTFVLSRGSPTRSGIRSSTFCDSLQQAVSRLTGSNLGFLPRNVKGKRELLIDHKAVRYGQLPNGQYFLHQYAYDWSDDLVEVARRLYQVQAKSRKDSARTFLLQRRAPFRL
jgi:hypothetical protein